MDITVKSVALYHIDKDSNTILKRDVSIADATSYIEELINKMIQNEKMRRYIIKTQPNSIVENIKNIIHQATSPKILEESAATSINDSQATDSLTNISNRLLYAQNEAQRRHAFTSIKKGSLIQSYVDNDGEAMYVLALIDHSSFIDESDLRRKSGLPYSSKATFKNARFHFNDDLTIKDIFISDSQSKISQYWYDDFLDLKETIDNISNTKKAFNFINAMLSNKISRKSKQDYLEYNNSLKVYFTKNKNFNFEECINFVFAGDPYSDKINIDDIKQEIITKRNTLNTFDNIFDIDTTDIKSSLRNRKYKLNSNVELNLKTSDDKIKENIFATNLHTGEIVLAINNVDKEQLKTFNFYNVPIE